MLFTTQTLSVVIGGHSGIGQAVAEALALRPGRVITASRENGLDISDTGSINAFFGALGTIDNLIITAGSQAPGGALLELDLQAAKQAFDTKFWGTLNSIRSAAAHLSPQGSITLTSGFLARKTVPGTLVKTAMNAALESAAKILARELAPIRVNVVSPGLTDTNAYAGLAPEARQAMLARAAATLPAGRYGQATDLAAGYLLAIDNPFMTGATIDIDGGALIN
ncbi:General stress protein 39 [Aeromonas jandaei]|uniref:SDR family oxidoreductase n=1 Tax=Aeromonas jandaei TaxID=650 RepID=UPI00191CD7E3|nr:SDR family oxidoreductase [Aeromonas jandaei]MBL0625348.1 SDR family oxidoreductase [Aeromonas jandaei]